MKSNLINYAYVEDDYPTWPSIIVNELKTQILSFLDHENPICLLHVL